MSGFHSGNYPGYVGNYGLMLEDMEQLKQYRKLGTPSELAELVKARNEGRLVELPFKVGDTVWFKFGGEKQIEKCWVYIPEGVIIYKTIGGSVFDCSNIGKTVFATQAEVKAKGDGKG